jgi:phage terminase large subunit
MASKFRVDYWSYDAAAMLEDLGLDPDPWQVEFLQSDYRRALLNCSRRSGKTTCAAIKALHTAMFSQKDKPTLTLIFAPAGKQSDELLYTLETLYKKLGRPVRRGTDKTSILDFQNGSRIMPMTGNPDSAVGWTPDLIIVDEASRVEDELFKSISPMLALKTRPCKLICLSTPYGKQGYFYREWASVDEQGNPRPKPADWKRVRITADDCPRLDKTVIENDRASYGELYVQQEYYCSFTQMMGLVYPGYEACIIDPVDLKQSPQGGDWDKLRAFGGADFGWHNPSCLLTGVLTPDDVLHVVAEVYGSHMTDEVLAAKARPLCDKWGMDLTFCDSANPQSIEKLRRGGIRCRAADKAVTDGIRAVGARMGTGRLFVHRTCPNLIRELGLYHYDPEKTTSKDDPVKENDHAPDALRYMVMGIDRGRRPQGIPEPPPDPTPPSPASLDPESPEAYRKPMKQTRFSKPEKPERTETEAEEQRRLNQEHLRDYGWESWR